MDAFGQLLVASTGMASRAHRHVEARRPLLGSLSPLRAIVCRAHALGSDPQCSHRDLVLTLSHARFVTRHTQNHPHASSSMSVDGHENLRTARVL